MAELKHTWSGADYESGEAMAEAVKRDIEEDAKTGEEITARLKQSQLAKLEELAEQVKAITAQEWSWPYKYGFLASVNIEDAALAPRAKELLGEKLITKWLEARKRATEEAKALLGLIEAGTFTRKDGTPWHVLKDESGAAFGFDLDEKKDAPLIEELQKGDRVLAYGITLLGGASIYYDFVGLYAQPSFDLLNLFCVCGYSTKLKTLLHEKRGEHLRRNKQPKQIKQPIDVLTTALTKLTDEQIERARNDEPLEFGTDRGGDMTHSIKARLKGWDEPLSQEQRFWMELIYSYLSDGARVISVTDLLKAAGYAKPTDKDLLPVMKRAATCICELSERWIEIDASNENKRFLESETGKRLLRNQHFTPYLRLSDINIVEYEKDESEESKSEENRMKDIIITLDPLDEELMITALPATLYTEAKRQLVKFDAEERVFKGLKVEYSARVMWAEVLRRRGWGKGSTTIKIGNLLDTLTTDRNKRERLKAQLKKMLRVRQQEGRLTFEWDEAGDRVTINEPPAALLDTNPTGQ